jgi:hypothetical protein
MPDKTFWTKLLDKTPLFLIVLGALLVLIGASGGWSLIHINFTSVAWQYIVAILGLGLIIFGGILVAREYSIRDEAMPIQATLAKSSKVIESIIMLKTGNQTTTLIPYKSGLQLDFDDRSGKNNSKKRFLSIQKLKQILKYGNYVSVSPYSSKGPKFGEFSLGPWKYWLYSKDSHANPEELKNKVIQLVNDIVEGSES